MEQYVFTESQLVMAPSGDHAMRFMAGEPRFVPSHLEKMVVAAGGKKVADEPEPAPVVEEAPTAEPDPELEPAAVAPAPSEEKAKPRSRKAQAKA